MYDEMIVVVEALKQRFNIDFNALEKSDAVEAELAAFFKSPQYTKWKQQS